MKKVLAVVLVLMLCFTMLTACGKSEAATNVDNLISSIGEVTLQSGDAIEAAEKAYAELGEEDLEQVEGKDTLDAARTTYDDLVNQDEAKKVDAAIDAIGDVTKNSKEVIAEARKVYDAASKEVQAYVTKLSVLETAESSLKALLKEEGKEALAKMYKDVDKVSGYTWYYPKAFPYKNGTWYYDTRSFILPYFGQQGDSYWMRLIFDCVGSDWTFFKSITINADGEMFYKTFKYSDIEHEVCYGKVAEFIDIDPSGSDVEMLRAMANAKTVYIRFEGDAHQKDITLKDTDKASIKNALKAYDALCD